jgi:hypothetical protein
MMSWKTFLHITSEDEVAVDIKYDKNRGYVYFAYNIFNSNFEFDKIYNDFGESIITKDGRSYPNLQAKEH